MNITPTMMYWFTRIDTIKNFNEPILVLSIITIVLATVFGILTYFMGKDVESEDISSFSRVLLKKIFPLALIPFFFCSCVKIFLPTQKEMAAIYVIPMVLNNEKVQKMSEDGIEAMSNVITLSNEWLKDLIESKKNAKGKK